MADLSPILRSFGGRTEYDLGSEPLGLIQAKLGVGRGRGVSGAANPLPGPDRPERPEFLFQVLFSCHRPRETAAPGSLASPRGDFGGPAPGVERARGSGGAGGTHSEAAEFGHRAQAPFRTLAAASAGPAPAGVSPAARLICMARPSPAAIGRRRAPPSRRPLPSAVGFRPPSARSCGQRADC